MIEKTLTIKNPHGLHARPAAEVARLASKFESDITIEKDGIECNAKSIMGVMMLAAECNSQILIKISGIDEAEAMLAFEKLNENNFHEK